VARTLPDGATERAILAGGHLNFYPKFEIKDSDGAWRELTVPALLASRDLTGWTNESGATANYNAVGIDGIANHATTITDGNAAAFSARALAFAIPNDNQTYRVRFWFAKDNDQTRFPIARLTLTGGTTQQRSVQIDTKTGAWVNANILGTGGTARVLDAGAFWLIEIDLPNNTSGNVTATARVFPAAGATFGTQSAAATGSVVVGHVRVESLDALDWLDKWRVEESLDNPVASATFVMRREIGSLSLAPLVQASTINRNAALAYVPLFTPPRLVRFSVASVANGVPPVAADYHEIFQGPIYSVDPAEPEDGMTVKAFDLGQLLQITMIETENTYGSGVGVAVQTVMQQIITAWVASNPTLVTPASPGWLVTTFTQSQVTVLQAIRELALQIGWDVRYLYQAGTNTPELRFYQPPRAAVTPDWSFTGDEYTRLPMDKIDDSDVRNVCTVNYIDGPTGTLLSTTRLNSPSITKFGRRFMEITEGASSNIDSLAEAQAMGDAAVADLGDPLEEHEIETLFFWPLQLNDLCRFVANGVHYDADQDLAAIAFVHDGQGGHATTTISARGKPMGAYHDWIRDAKPADSGGGSTPTQAQPPIPIIRYQFMSRLGETVTLDAVYDPTMAPIRWQTKLDNGAWSALTVGGLPQDVTIPTKPVTQQLRLKVIQADGQYDETAYVIHLRTDDSAPTQRERPDRERYGGMPTPFGRFNPLNHYDSTGAVLLLDALLGQVTTDLGASDGVKGIESTRGSNKKSARAGAAAHGHVDEDRIRAGDGGISVALALIRALPLYTSDGVSPLIDTALGIILSALKMKQSVSMEQQGSTVPMAVDSIPFSASIGGPGAGQMWVAWTWSGFNVYRPSATGLLAIPAASAMATPPSASGRLTQAAGGALAGRTRFVRIGYVRDQKCYRVGAEASIVLSANNLMTVQAPVAIAGYDGWCVVVGSATNTERFQVTTLNPLAFGNDWTEPVGGADVTGKTPYNSAMDNAITEIALDPSPSVYNWMPFWDLDDQMVRMYTAFTTNTPAQSLEALRDRRIPLATAIVGSGVKFNLSATMPAAGGSGSSTGGGRY
jgi:hypothetical protein